MTLQPMPTSLPSRMPAAPPPLQPRRQPFFAWLERLPWWLLLAILLGVVMLWHILTDADYRVIFNAISRGIGTTIWVTLVSFAGALIVGLIVGLMRLSRHKLIYELATFYVEIIRGVPMLVLLYYIAFVGIGQIEWIVNWVGNGLAAIGLGFVGQPLGAFRFGIRGFLVSSILALVIAYSAFISEIFRAGIQSIERGQIEAASSMGMSRWQTMRFIVLPQAVRRVLPPLGNDFIAMLKDSSLVSVLGVRDITLVGKLYATSTFMFFETYNVMAFLYLVMTIGLTLFLRWLEKKMPQTA